MRTDRRRVPFTRSELVLIAQRDRALTALRAAEAERDDLARQLDAVHHVTSQWRDQPTCRRYARTITRAIRNARREAITHHGLTR